MLIPNSICSRWAKRENVALWECREICLGDSLLFLGNIFTPAVCGHTTPTRKGPEHTVFILRIYGFWQSIARLWNKRGKWEKKGKQGEPGVRKQSVGSKHRNVNNRSRALLLVAFQSRFPNAKVLPLFLSQPDEKPINFWLHVIWWRHNWHKPCILH